jgi:transaldolase
MPINGGDSETVIEECAKAGIDVKKLADHLQSEGTTGFVKSWKDLLNCIESKNSTLAATI